MTLQQAEHLIEEFRPTMDLEVMHSWAADAAPFVQAVNDELGKEYRPSMDHDVLVLWASDAMDALNQGVTLFRLV